MGDFAEPAVLQPHQAALKAFLLDLPPLGQQLTSTAEGSATLQAPFTQSQLTALQGVRSNATFTRYTGYDQPGLLKKWLTDRTTTCNEFCGRCGAAMGYKSSGKNDGVGRFDIADYLTRYGRGHCWEPAESGSKPEYGDVFRLFAQTADHNGTNLNHMGVSLGVSGDDWYTVESGQGGPSKGYDAIERKKRAWTPASLQGWVNMQALLTAGAALPYWLGGWWEVFEEPYDTWYYYFGSNGKVLCTTVKPASLSAPPAGNPLVGNFHVKGMFGLEVSWQSPDPNESFSLGEQSSEKRKFTMLGTKAGTIQKIKATRMMIKGVL